MVDTVVDMVKDGEYDEKEVKDAVVTCDRLAVTYSLLRTDYTYMCISSDIWLDYGLIQSRLCPKLLLRNAWCESSSQKAWVMIGNSNVLNTCTCNFAHG